MMKLVDQMFDWIFSEQFEEGEDEIDTYAYRDAITNQIEGDGMAQPLLDLFDPKTKENITREEIRTALTNLLRQRLDEYKEHIEEHEDERNEAIEKSGGKFAHDYI